MRAVTAVVTGVSAADAVRLDAGRQLEVLAAPTLADVRDAAERAASELLWIVDAAARVTPATLQQLLDAAYTPAVSMPVDAGGQPVEAAIGRFVENDAAALLEEARERRVPLRRTAVASMLVERELVLREAAPDPVRFGAHAGSEWTERLFSARRGMLVPASRVQVEDSRGGRAGVAATLRTARASAWGRGETLRELQRALRG